MVSYYLNWMGPINSKWIEENGDHWATGRIDIEDGSAFGSEIGVTAMQKKDWDSFSNFLHHLQTEEAWTLAQIEEAYEAAGYAPIRWREPERKEHNF
ncbi:MAG: hypothetical protein ACXABY_34260 [Candidatus Thorarchaeota archaeon]|jgi:hypothetical protein